MFNERGFTLIELVMIIVILGILSAVAIPNYYSLQSDAQSAAELGVVGGVRSGISTFYANECNEGTCAWPTNSDVCTANAAACSSVNPCFDGILAQGITSDWTKNSANTWTGPASTMYTYTEADGTFQE